jgi:hypothetical protein
LTIASHEGWAYNQAKEDPDVKTEMLSQSFARRAAWLALLSVAVSAIFVAVPSASRADAAWVDSVLSIEAENFEVSIDAGGLPISASFDTSCGSGSSGGGSVDGLDYPGDWIQMWLSFPDPIVFRNSLRSASEIRVRSKYVIQFIGVNGQGVAVSDTLTTLPGRGIT